MFKKILTTYFTEMIMPLTTRCRIFISCFHINAIGSTINNKQNLEISKKCVMNTSNTVNKPLYVLCENLDITVKIKVQIRKINPFLIIQN